jgi:hypothetical protein
LSRTVEDATDSGVLTLVTLRYEFDHAATAARWQVDGLTDDEYLWEPVQPCWSVRRRDETDWPHVWGRGEFVVEDMPFAGAVQSRVTTIGWRLVHLAAWLDVYRVWVGGAPDQYPLPDFEVPSDAAGAVAWLARAQAAFAHELTNRSETDLALMVTTAFGEHRSIENLIRGMIVEELHHSAEIGCLRDIHRGRPRSEWWPEPPEMRDP